MGKWSWWLSACVCLWIDCARYSHENVQVCIWDCNEGWVWRSMLSEQGGRNEGGWKWEMRHWPPNLNPWLTFVLGCRSLTLSTLVQLPLLFGNIYQLSAWLVIRVKLSFFLLSVLVIFLSDCWLKKKHSLLLRPWKNHSGRPKILLTVVCLNYVTGEIHGLFEVWL